MTLLQSGLAKSLAEDYTIDQSLRFDKGDSAYLSRTLGTATDSSKFTISAWVKKAEATGNASDTYQYIFGAGSDSNNRAFLRFDTTDHINFEAKVSSSWTLSVKTDAQYRDPSSWYHVLANFDSDSGTSEIYVNGVEVDYNGTPTIPSDSSNVMFNTAVQHVVGSDYAAATYYWNNYIAEFHFIDGQDLDPSSFGETDSTTNQWKPIEYDGTYGVNGFYQKYANTELADSFEDSSGPWTVDAFTSTGSDTWTCPTGVTSAEILVVAGGGGGGFQYGGGGGAGGIVHHSTYSVTAGVVYDLTVGAGGAGSRADSAAGTSGSDSVWNVNAEGSGSTMTAVGGGGGASRDSGEEARDGGSGGGGSAFTNLTGGSTNQGAVTGATVYGNDGGDGYANASPASYPNGGGGGASAVGGDAVSGQAGAGGNGQTFSTFTAYGVSGVFGGGGGGCAHSYYPDTRGTGGSGGGGDGAQRTPSADPAGGNGTANTGSGGGGNGGDVDGGNGGSGVILIAYFSSTGTVVTKRHTITANGDVANTRAQQKVGDSSIVFDGTGDYLSVPDSSDFDFGSGEFTMEAWCFTDNTTVGRMIMQQGDASAGNRSWWLRIKSDVANKMCFAWSTDGTWQSNQLSDPDDLPTDAWVHVAITRDTNTLRLYINGVQKNSTSETGSLYDAPENLNIGQEWDGYMDEVRISDTCRYPDGTTFTPSATEFTADSNTLLLIHSNWNGGLGADSSGNYNTFTPTNLVATDQMEDSPTNNFATLNPLWQRLTASTFSEGNLKFAGPSVSAQSPTKATIGVTSGKWYCEFYINGLASQQAIGVVDSSLAADYIDGGSANVIYREYRGQDGQKRSNDGIASYGASYTTGDIISVTLNLTDGEITFFKNDATQGVAYTNLVSAMPSGGWTFFVEPGQSGDILTANFGQDSSFAGVKTAQGNQDDNGIGDFYYDVPAGYLALCTSNLSDPSIADPTDHCNAVLYVGNGGSSTDAITGVGFKPDLNWIKGRTNATSNYLTDSVRGIAGSGLLSDSVAAEDGIERIASLDSDGFTTADALYSYVNTSSANYVAWNWKGDGVAGGTLNEDGTEDSYVNANTTAGFSIVKYTGNDTVGATYGHGLSQQPELIITRSYENAQHWYVWRDGFTDYEALLLNRDLAIQTESDQIWDVSGFTSSVVELGDHSDVNKDGSGFIAYIFHSVEGYSKIGSYVGNGDADGTFIYCGFRPSLFLVKCSDTGSTNWLMYDNKRDLYNVTEQRLEPDTSDAEDTDSNDVLDFVSNGIKLRGNGGGLNYGSRVQIYMAFAESPFKTANAR